MSVEKKRKCTFDCFNWVLKIIGIILLAIIATQLCFNGGCYDYNSIALTLVLSFVGILATFVVVNNFGQVSKIERQMSDFERNIKEFQGEYFELREYYLQGVILFAKASILREFIVTYPQKVTELFIAELEAIESLTMCSKIIPNRERDAMPTILVKTMDSIEKAKVSFRNEDLIYIKDMFKNILTSNRRQLRDEERKIIVSVKERFHRYTLQY